MTCSLKIPQVMKIAIYCLSNMYLKHVFVKTSRLFWTTLSHTWNDNEASVRPKCELILLYLGHGRYGEYISVVTPESEVLTLEDLSTNRPTAPTAPTSHPAIRVNSKKSGMSAVPQSDSHNINKPSNKKGIKNKQTKQKCATNDPIPGKWVTRNKRHINYVDLNLGIDSNDDSSPPRKCKQSKVVALREPSQTVIAARNQRITRKSLQKSNNEQTKLIGTVIITPPAKEIKDENDGKKVKTEQDWLKLPKNVPKENISLDDLNVRPRLIHKDGTICHSKTYWSSIKRKPPLKEFELPDLFTDNEELETEKLTKNMSPKKSTLTDTCMDKDTSLNENKGTVVNTEKSENETAMLSENTANDMPSKGPSSTELRSVNTEKTGEVIQTEPASILIEHDSDNTTNKNNVSAENDAVNTENGATNSEIDPNDNKSNKQDGEGALVTTENDTSVEKPTSNHVNTVNTSETDHKNSTATDQKPNRDIMKIQGHDAVNINTEKSPHNHDEPTTSTPKTHNQKVIKDEWSSLLFSSDDSLFDEMTKQLEDDTTRSKTGIKTSPSATCTITAASTSTQDQETLPDIVYTSSRTDAATGLLMLGADPKDMDMEIDNKLVMPINKPKEEMKS